MLPPRPRPSATNLLATLIAVLILVACTVACGSDSEVSDLEQRSAPELPPATGDPTLRQGYLWALSPEAPYRALRLELVPTDDPDAWTGTWISFSWRGSSQADSLNRRSLPVELSARIERQELVITGPAPQFDEPGTPNGDHGVWELRVRRVSPPDMPAVYSGIMVHDEYTSPRGVTVMLTPTFEVWSK